ncbi:MAG: GTP-binding protein, partial [Clostridia bacterium]|nr:GTP-binding protein [Clostridia bacterium]
MTKIDIFSGFLGAGKTTLIKKLISEGYKGERIVLIENEFGEIGIDGGFLKEAGIQINEMNSGCICCSLVGDFSKALHQVIEEYAPDRILIEPSGVGKLSDVIKAVKNAEIHGAVLGSFTTVADATKCRIYMKNFGEFYNDQIENAGTIFLSRTKGMAQEKIDKAVELLREKNPDAVIVTTDWDSLTGQQMIRAMEENETIEKHLHELEEEHKAHHEHHEHHHHDHDEHCSCGCHDHDHEHEHEHEHKHEHHHNDGHEHCHEHHEHHHDHDEHCSCGCHDHEHEHHHHHHHADEVFTSYGVETTHKFTKEQLENILESLDDEHEYGIVLRAKG